MDEEWLCEEEWVVAVAATECWEIRGVATRSSPLRLFRFTLPSLLYLVPVLPVPL